MRKTGAFMTEQKMEQKTSIKEQIKLLSNNLERQEGLGIQQQVHMFDRTDTGAISSVGFNSEISKSIHDRGKMQQFMTTENLKKQRL